MRALRPTLLVAALAVACAAGPPSYAQEALPGVPTSDDAGEAGTLALRAQASAALRGEGTITARSGFTSGDGGGLLGSASPMAVLHGVAGRTFTLVPLALPAPQAPRRVALRVGPNPFGDRADVSFDLPMAGRVELRIYDLAGRQVRVLLDGEWFPPGTHTQSWDGREGGGRSAAAGVYFVKLRAPGGESRRTIVRR